MEALQKIGGSRAGCILSKSVTLEKQQGNDLPRSIQKIELGAGYCEGSINSEGLPNEGVDYCKFPEQYCRTLSPLEPLPDSHSLSLSLHSPTGGELESSVGVW